MLICPTKIINFLYALHMRNSYKSIFEYNHNHLHPNVLLVSSIYSNAPLNTDGRQQRKHRLADAVGGDGHREACTLDVGQRSLYVPVARHCLLDQQLRQFLLLLPDHRALTQTMGCLQALLLQNSNQRQVLDLTFL